MMGSTFSCTVTSCGQQKEFTVSVISLDYFEATCNHSIVWLWRRQGAWTGSTNAYCEETVQAIGAAIDRHYNFS